LVLDRINGVAYVGLSERADEALARQWAEAVGYQELVTFRWGGRRGAGNVQQLTGASARQVLVQGRC
jgi:hypothetical protein